MKLSLAQRVAINRLAEGDVTFIVLGGKPLPGGLPLGVTHAALDALAHKGLIIRTTARYTGKPGTRYHYAINQAGHAWLTQQEEK